MEDNLENNILERNEASKGGSFEGEKDEPRTTIAITKKSELTEHAESQGQADLLGTTVEGVSLKKCVIGCQSDDSEAGVTEASGVKIVNAKCCPPDAKKELLPPASGKAEAQILSATARNGLTENSMNTTVPQLKRDREDSEAGVKEAFPVKTVKTKGFLSDTEKVLVTTTSDSPKNIHENFCLSPTEELLTNTTTTLEERPKAMGSKVERKTLIAETEHPSTTSESGSTEKSMDTIVLQLNLDSDDSRSSENETAKSSSRAPVSEEVFQIDRFSLKQEAFVKRSEMGTTTTVREGSKDTVSISERRAVKTKAKPASTNTNYPLHKEASEPGISASARKIPQDSSNNREEPFRKKTKMDITAIVGNEDKTTVAKMERKAVKAKPKLKPSFISELISDDDNNGEALANVAAKMRTVNAKDEVLGVRKTPKSKLNTSAKKAPQSAEDNNSHMPPRKKKKKNIVATLKDGPKGMCVKENKRCVKTKAELKSFLARKPAIAGDNTKAEVAGKTKTHPVNSRGASEQPQVTTSAKKILQEIEEDPKPSTSKLQDGYVDDPKPSTSKLQDGYINATSQDEPEDVIEVYATTKPELNTIFVPVPTLYYTEIELRLASLVRKILTYELPLEALKEPAEMLTKMINVVVPAERIAYKVPLFRAAYEIEEMIKKGGGRSMKTKAELKDFFVPEEEKKIGKRLKTKAELKEPFHPKVTFIDERKNTPSENVEEIIIKPEVGTSAKEILQKPGHSDPEAPLGKRMKEDTTATVIDGPKGKRLRRRRRCSKTKGEVNSARSQAVPLSFMEKYHLLEKRISQDRKDRNPQASSGKKMNTDGSAAVTNIPKFVKGKRGLTETNAKPEPCFVSELTSDRAGTKATQIKAAGAVKIAQSEEVALGHEQPEAGTSPLQKPENGDPEASSGKTIMNKDKIAPNDVKGKQRCAGNKAESHTYFIPESTPGSADAKAYVKVVAAIKTTQTSAVQLDLKLLTAVPKLNSSAKETQQKAENNAAEASPENRKMKGITTITDEPLDMRVMGKKTCIHSTAELDHCYVPALTNDPEAEVQIIAEVKAPQSRSVPVDFNKPEQLVISPPARKMLHDPEASLGKMTDTPTTAASTAGPKAMDVRLQGAASSLGYVKPEFPLPETIFDSDDSITEAEAVSNGRYMEMASAPISTKTENPAHNEPEPGKHSSRSPENEEDGKSSRKNMVTESENQPEVILEKQGGSKMTKTEMLAAMARVISVVNIMKKQSE